MSESEARGVKRVRDQDNDPIIDRHGNPASTRLFVDKLPRNTIEDDVRAVFQQHEGFVGVQLGNKALRPGEFRTCVVTFVSAEHAAAARASLQHFQGPGWTAPILINFVKQDTRDVHHYTTHLSGEVIHDRDTLGNPACATLFVKNFVPTITHEHIRGLFPTATKVLAGTKELRPGEFRTAYISFDGIAAAVAARHNANGYTDIQQQVPLIVNYSVRPFDQPKQLHSMSVPHLPAAIPYGMSRGFPAMPEYAFPFDYGQPRGFGPLMGDFGVNVMGGARGIVPRTNFPSTPHMMGMPGHGEALPGGFTIVDLVDSKGNPATNTLFVDCLPYDVRESTLRNLFGNTTGFRGLQMGNKILQPNEYRTAVVHYNIVENAVRARAQIQYHREPDWARPLIIRYVKH